MRLTFTCLCLLILSNCATMNSQECLNADWRIIGIEDGSRGQSIAKLSQHRKACAKHNITPNLEEYKLGLNEGYKSYCTLENGYQIGVSGGHSKPVCKGTLKQPFLTAFNDGHKHHLLTVDVNQLNAALEQSYSRIESLHTDNQFHEDQLVYHSQRPIERQEHLQAIKDNNAEISAIEYDVPQLLEEYNEAANKLDSIRLKHSRMGY